MLHKIVHREGFGDVLADGILPAAEKIGRGTSDYANQVKGLPMYTSYTPNRLIPLKGEALGMVVSRGDTMKTQVYAEYAQVFQELPLKFDEKTAAEQADTIRQGLRKITGTEQAALSESYQGKPELVAYIEDGIIIDDCLSFCKLMGGSFSNSVPMREKRFTALLTSGTGTEMSEDKLFEFARRVKNLERAYNVREGMTRDNDLLPKRCMDRPILHGDFKGSVLESIQFEKMKDRYYALRGWDIATGIPTRETLEQYGLGYVARELEKLGKLPGLSPPP